MSDLDWSHLPKELLAMICNRCKTHLEHVRFRSVCHSWRSSAPQPSAITPIFPLPDIPHTYASLCFHKGYSLEYLEGQDTDSSPSVYSLVESNIYSLQAHSSCFSSSSSSSKSWLMKLQETKPNVFQFIGPLSRSPIRLLPEMLANDLNTLNPTKLRISGVCKEHHLQREKSHHESIRDNYVSGHNGLGTKELHLLDRFVLKTVVLSPRSTVSDFVVMAIHYWGSLFVYKSGDTKWNPIEDQKASFHDVIYYRGQFYVVDGAGSTYIADPVTCKLIHLVLPFPDDGGERKRLVEANGELFLVDVYMDKKRRPEEWCEIRARTYQWGEVISSLAGAPFFQSLPKWKHFSLPTGCRVFKLDENLRKWRQVESLGDQIFCVGDRSTFSVSGTISVRL